MIQIFKKRSAIVVKEQRAMPSLLACLLMDFIGYATYAIPFFGEFLDILWAPVSAIIFWKMFGFRKGFFGHVSIRRDLSLQEIVAAKYFSCPFTGVE